MYLIQCCLFIGKNNRLSSGTRDVIINNYIRWLQNFNHINDFVVTFSESKDFVSLAIKGKLKTVAACSPAAA